MNTLRQYHNARRNPGRNHDEGFTLIELLIVMSIIIVLMALAIPQGLRMRKNSNAHPHH